MSYTFKPTNLAEIPELVQEYVETLSSPIESFLEYHILNSQVYVISSMSAGDVGYFALYEKKLLTQFYLRPNVIKDGQQLFSAVLSHSEAETAFIPTCDELFLSHALDQETSISKQAYFFRDDRKIEDKTYRDSDFRLATQADIDDIRRISGDYFEPLEASVRKSELFVLRDANVLLGVGMIEPGRLLKGYSSVGIFTNEQFRQRGIGRNIIIRLKQLCYEHGQIPVAGCNYYNINSKKTLESAGMITQTRLLKVHFLADPSSPSVWYVAP